MPDIIMDVQGGDMQITEVKQVNDEIVEAFNRLIPQLSTTNLPPTREELEEIVAAGTSHLLIARDDTGRIVGGLTVVIFRIPTGLRTRIRSGRGTRRRRPRRSDHRSADADRHDAPPRCR